MNDNHASNIEAPKHQAARTFLRVGGPIVALVGLAFMGTGLVSFFSAFGTFQPPRLFWCCFVGMPLLFVGLVMCKFGYLGTVIRFVAAETAPVAKDTINYMANNTQAAVKTVARAVAQGVREAREERNT